MYTFQISLKSYAFFFHRYKQAWMAGRNRRDDGNNVKGNSAWGSVCRGHGKWQAREEKKHQMEI